jgi:hypothetical protein
MVYKATSSPLKVNHENKILVRCLMPQVIANRDKWRVIVLNLWNNIDRENLKYSLHQKTKIVRSEIEFSWRDSWISLLCSKVYILIKP